MDSLTIRTSIQRDLKRHLLLRGTLLGLIGISLLLYAGIFLDTATLSRWGIPLVLASALLIGGGLVPYKRVVKLETKPNSLTLTERGELHYMRPGWETVSYPVESIEKIEFLEGKYGIKMTFKTARPLFFPHFSRRGFEELRDCLELG